MCSQLPLHTKTVKFLHLYNSFLCSEELTNGERKKSHQNKLYIECTSQRANKSTQHQRSKRPMIQITSTVQQYEKWLIIMPKTKQQTLSFLFMFRLLLLLLNERAHRNYLITFSKRIAYITRSIPPRTEDWKFILISWLDFSLVWIFFSTFFFVFN